MDRSKRREQRNQELKKLSVDQLGEILPYKKNEVTAIKSEPSNRSILTKDAMIETILAYEGLGQE